MNGAWLKYWSSVSRCVLRSVQLALSQCVLWSLRVAVALVTVRVVCRMGVVVRVRVELGSRSRWISMQLGQPQWQRFDVVQSEDADASRSIRPVLEERTVGVAGVVHEPAQVSASCCVDKDGPAIGGGVADLNGVIWVVASLFLPGIDQIANIFNDEGAPVYATRCNDTNSTGGSKELQWICLDEAIATPDAIGAAPVVTHCVGADVVAARSTVAHADLRAHTGLESGVREPRVPFRTTGINDGANWGYGEWPFLQYDDVLRGTDPRPRRLHTVGLWAVSKMYYNVNGF
ncbi:hypothetical protein F442_21455 [Phytophthora nicotianae P10297]|uniref:Uncharacterized protein n=1 Tax=Phytophthora nicotianae P10297 TaxID=1317064 RepID=W2Y348_PHYNI|nr:hypothetical protein F442_21455 [Phytophthora nicotianae P10297]